MRPVSADRQRNIEFARRKKNKIFGRVAVRFVVRHKRTRTAGLLIRQKTNRQKKKFFVSSGEPE